MRNLLRTRYGSFSSKIQNTFNEKIISKTRFLFGVFSTFLDCKTLKFNVFSFVLLI